MQTIMIDSAQSFLDYFLRSASTQKKGQLESTFIDIIDGSHQIQNNATYLKEWVIESKGTQDINSVAETIPLNQQSNLIHCSGIRIRG